MKKIELEQDSTRVDPKHYTVDFENDRVRVVRIKYGPHEKSMMHDHTQGVAVFLTDNHVKMTYPDGKTDLVHEKAGATKWQTKMKHLPENLSNDTLEVIYVELKD